MQKLLQVCCAAVALTAMAACSDSVTSPVQRSPSVVHRDVITTPNTCSSTSTLVEFKLVGGSTFSGLVAATAPVKNPAWHTPITGSSWIIPTDAAFSSANAPDFATSHYQASFTVPANAGATLNGSSWADNQLTQILIDNTGGSIGGNSTLSDPVNYGFDPVTLGETGSPITWSSSVSAGPHTLDLYVANNNVTQPTNPTGLDFCFSVTYTTPPPPAVALFVIGNNQPHAIDDIVNFWGAQWWKHNPTSTKSDNGWESFKGFAPVSDNVCGGKWSSGPGNSDPPPAAPLPSSINIIVTDKVNKNGNTLSGNIVQIITVTQDGTVTAVLCPAG